MIGYQILMLSLCSQQFFVIKGFLKGEKCGELIIIVTPPMRVRFRARHLLFKSKIAEFLYLIICFECKERAQGVFECVTKHVSCCQNNYFAMSKLNNYLVTFIQTCSYFP